MKSMTAVFCAAAVAFAAAAGPAMARDEVFTARLQGPAPSEQVIAHSTVWRCEGDTCLARPDHPASLRACRAFVREAGPVSAYGPENARLSEEQIAACNLAARAPGASHQARN